MTRPPGTRRFDDATEARICTLYAAGRSSYSLAADLGCSPQTIVNIVVRRGGTAHPVGDKTCGRSARARGSRR